MIDFFQSVILRIHDATGCSWAAAIMGTALVVRTCCFPLILSATRARRKRAALAPMMAAAKQKVDIATQEKKEGVGSSERENSPHHDGVVSQVCSHRCRSRIVSVTRILATLVYAVKLRPSSP